MPSRRPVLLITTLVVLAPVVALGAVLRSGEEVVVRTDEPLEDDLYVAGDSVRIERPIDGDLVVAGGDVVVAAPVEGSVVAAGGQVRVLAPVGRSVRAAGGTVIVEAEVGRDVVAAGGEILVGAPTTVAGDAVLAGGTLRVDGVVNGDVLARGGELVMAGEVGGDVSSRTRDLSLVDGAVVGGALRYASTEPASIAPGARVSGPTEALPGAPEPGPFAWIYWRFRAFIAWLAFGVLLLVSIPRVLARAQDELYDRPWADLGGGLLLTVAIPPIAALIIGIGALAGGWWIGVVLVGLLLLGLVSGLVVTAIAVGRLLLNRFRRGRGGPDPVSLMLGALLVAFVGAIPVLGFVAILVAMLMGLGALWQAAMRSRREAGPLYRPRRPVPTIPGGAQPA